MPMCKRRVHAYARKQELVYPVSCALDSFTTPLIKSQTIEFCIDADQTNNTVVMNIHVIKNEVKCLRRYYNDIHTCESCTQMINDWDDDDY